MVTSLLGASTRPDWRAGGTFTEEIHNVMLGTGQLWEQARMSTEEQNGKSRRRAVSKATRKQVERPIKVGLYLSLDASRRLGIAATMEGLDRSQIVDELIRTHLRKYVVQVRSERPGAEVLDESQTALD